MSNTTTIPKALQKLCLGIPNTEQVRSHDIPKFKVGGLLMQSYRQCALKRMLTTMQD